MPLANDAFLNVVNRIKATGTPIAWPTIAMGGFVDQLQWQAPNMATYTSINSAADAQAFYFGNSFFQRGSQQYGNHFGLNQVHIASGDYVQYWQALFNQGYVIRTPDQPHIMTAGITGFDFETGGRPRQDQPALAITGMSGSIMTTSAPHGIGLPTNVVFPWVKVQITGNSDPAMNTNWYAAYPTSPTTVPLYSRTIGKPGCTPDQTTKGNVSIRGISHAVVTSAYFNLLMVSPNAPSDLLPGESIIWTGNGAACANDTYAFAGFNPNNPTTWLALSQYANSSGTGGTVHINDDYGFVNPLFDHAMFTGLPGTIQTDLALEAMWGDAGARIYTGASVAAAQAIFQATVPEDGAEQQTTASPYTTFPIDQQQRWWAGAQGLAFVKRLAPCYLGTLQPSPNFSAPWVRSGLTQCADGSKILTLINTSQNSQVISVPLGTYQISINPISVYRIGYPYFTTDLITGAAGTISETIPPGAAVAFVAHSSTNSFVQLVPFSFTLPSGATKMALRFTYGYPGPLQEYEQSFLCPASPCLVPLDMNMARIYGQTMALDSNNVRLSTSDFVFLGGQ